jgi:hypothetical protein
MTIVEFCGEYPKLMHMAQPDSWASICRHGLLSTRVIADRLGLVPEERFALLSERRKTSKSYPGFTVRDQRPMDAKLAGCLDDGTTPIHQEKEEEVLFERSSFDRD